MPRFMLEKRPPPPFWFRVLIPILAVLIAFALCSVLIIIAGANPFTAYYQIIVGALGSRLSRLETFVKVAPLVLTGIAVAVAFTAQFWNIGAEGQLYAGAIAATWFGITLVDSPAAALIPLVLVGGFVAGAIWALLPAYLKVRFKVDDVVTTLLLNWVIIYLNSALLNGPWRDPISGWPYSPDIAAGAQFPTLIARSRFHLGIVVAFVMAAIVWVILRHTILGFRMRSVGANPTAANFAGISVGQTVLLTALISGGIAGLAGVGEVCGVQYRLIEGLSPGYGYSGIVIAMLGGLHPVGVVLAAFLFGIVITGAQAMSRATGVPIFLADVIQGVTLLVMLAMLLLTQYRVRRIK